MKTLFLRSFTFWAVGVFSLNACSTSEHSNATKAQLHQAGIAQSVYGYLPNGEQVDQYVLSNSSGVEVSIITYGGIITSLKTPDKNGKLGDIVLGYDSLEDYLKGISYFGALIGRYGNRIGQGELTIDGKTYQLPTNDGANHLHGGNVGFDKRNWQATAFKTNGNVGLKMSLFSKDGDQGYPGNLSVQVVYTLTPADELVMAYSAVTDKPTVVNLTQHSYFNLSAGGTILNHQLMIPADNITPVDKGLIPTGKLDSVANSPFDFRALTAIGDRIDQNNTQLKYGLGYDHNFVLNKSAQGAFELAAKVVDPASGRILEVFTEEPAIQFYSGNFLNGKTKGKGRTFNFRDGLCLEPQHNPDSPNKPHFASTVLRPGEIYSTTMSYRFDVQK